MGYLERIIALSPEWRLVSDVEEWLTALSVRARLSAWGFVRKHLERIHHCPGVHAKVVISTGIAVLGSANLTRIGITARAEMGILLTDAVLVAELAGWFEDLWRESAAPVVDETAALVRWLDEQAAQSPARRDRFLLSATGRRVRAKLVAMSTTPAPATAITTPALSLNRLAASVVASQQVHYDSAESAVAAAVETLTVTGSFHLRDVVALVRSGAAGATAREAYLLLLQHCANHPRSVFAETTRNRLTLADGAFTTSTHDGIVAALAPFDAFLAYLVRCLAFDKADTLPPEAQVEHDTGMRGQDQVLLIDELVTCGFLQLEDIAGELPRFRLLFDFEWLDRYRLFQRAHNLWRLHRSEAQTRPPLREANEDDEGDAEGAELEERTNDFAAGDAGATLQALFAASFADKTKHRKDRRLLDLVQSRVLAMLISGPPAEAASTHTLLAEIGTRLALSRNELHMLHRLPASHTPALRFVNLPDERCRVEINEGVQWNDLALFPKTRAVCEQFLGAGRSSDA